jgi:hypothetical protein
MQDIVKYKIKRKQQYCFLLPRSMITPPGKRIAYFRLLGNVGKEKTVIKKCVLEMKDNICIIKIRKGRNIRRYM